MNIEEEKKEYNNWVKTLKWEKTRVDIINFIIKKFDYKRYLEIGVNDGYCFSKINIEYKDGVDPKEGPFTNHQMSSDDFFENIENNNKYDIVFIDGLHHDFQVYKDIINSLNHLNNNGTIVCHDMNPPFEICQEKELIVSSWNGDCWKAFVKLRSERKDLNMFTIDTDWGLGIIRFGSQETITIPKSFDYCYLKNNRNEILNLISVEDFYKKF